MANFDVTCPQRYPMKCNLGDIEIRELIQHPGKYKVFFMYPDSVADEFHTTLVKEFLISPSYHLIDWSVVIAPSAKFCKICRFMLAADFGIALLTPRNYNVFFEVGYMWGLSKPVLFLFDENNRDHLDSKSPPLHVNDLPFDLGDQIVLKYSSENNLKQQLPDYLAQIAKKVRLIRPFEERFRLSISERIRKIKEYPKPEIVAELLLQHRLISKSSICSVYRDHFETDVQVKKILESIRSETGFIDTHDRQFYEVNPTFRPYLEDLFFTTDSIEKIIERDLRI